jgi:hypothetical protein
VGVVLHPGKRETRSNGRLPWVGTVVLLSLVIVVLLVRQDRQPRHPEPVGSGRAATVVRHVPPFRRVELAGSSNVMVTAGQARSVAVTADDNLLRRVTTRVRGGILVIDTVGSYSTRVPMIVRVSVPSLRSLSLSGSGTVGATGISERQLTISLSGSGVVRAGGRVDRLAVTLSGSGDAQLGGLRARDARAVVAGSGRIVVRATRTLVASVPGSGAVFYLGHPAKVTRTVTGSGAVVGG